MSEDPETNVVHRQLDTEEEDPTGQIVEAVSDLEGTPATDLPPLWSCVDGMLDDLFSTPPDPEAQMTVEFSYGTYRITIDQEGTATFVKTE